MDIISCGDKKGSPDVITLHLDNKFGFHCEKSDPLL